MCFRGISFFWGGCEIYFIYFVFCHRLSKWVDVPSKYLFCYIYLDNLLKVLICLNSRCASILLSIQAERRAKFHTEIQSSMLTDRSFNYESMYE